MKHWVETYPHEVHASVLLLDNKIENWKIGERARSSPFDWKMRVSDFDKLSEFRCETKSWTANDPKEHEEVFTKHAPEWFKRWEHADSYGGRPAYTAEVTYKSVEEIKREYGV